MPTDLPPDYKPRPMSDPADAGNPVPAPPKGEDSRDGQPGVPRPGPDAGVGLPGADGDVVDPTGVPGGVPAGVPAPAGLPTF